MKRTAFITGPTPPFIRWAISFPCPLTRPAGPAGRSRHPAGQAWRELRGLKEVSRALAESRHHAGYCFSPQSTPERVIGVSLQEVTTPFGGSEKVARTCLECPANPLPGSDYWAACTGILPLVAPAASVEQTTAAWSLRRSNIEQAINPGKGTPPGINSWCQVWKGPALTSPKIGAARELHRVATGLFEDQAVDHAELGAALRHAELANLSLWIEPVPAGYSDGQSWTLPAYCRWCGSEWRGPLNGSSGKVCPVCTDPAGYWPQQKLKVLGLRPYLQLSAVIGDAAARRLQLEYQTRRRLEAHGP